MGNGYNEYLPSQKPFMWIEEETHVPDSKVVRDIWVLSFGAYNAMGLIGPEKGGVAVVHKDPNFVIATWDVPYNPTARHELHKRVVDTLTTVTDPMDCIEKIKGLSGADMRYE